MPHKTMALLGENAGDFGGVPGGNMDDLPGKPPGPANMVVADWVPRRELQ